MSTGAAAATTGRIASTEVAGGQTRVRPPLLGSRRVSDWKKAIEAEWTRRHGDARNGILFPLIAQSFDAREIVAATETLLTGRLTMADRVREYEERFASFVGAK